jgi:hypothetical protein
MHALLLALASFATQAPAAHDARTVTGVFHVGEEAVWVFEADGKRLGHHASRYIGRDSLSGVDAHHFQGAIQLSVPQLGNADLRATADLWTDDLGHPIRFVQQALVGESYSRVELEVAGAKSKAHIVQGPSARDADVNVDPAAYLLANNSVSHIEIAALLQPPGKDAQLAMFSANALKGLTYALTYKGAFDEDVGGVHRKGDAFDDSLGERLRFVDGRLFDVEVKAQRLVIRRTDEHFDRIAIAPPAVASATTAFDTEEVRIEHDGAVIAGAVTKRKGAPGRLPAVFFISGSGAQDRNGVSSGLDLGTHEILDRLTSEGFLVLRVDDRGAGSSSALPRDVSYLDLVADARACVEHLEKRDDVDAARIALIGHSEGAETATILAAERPRIAAVVLMAPAGRSILDVILDQNRLALTKQGLAADEIEKQLKDVRAFLVRLASDEAIDPASASSPEAKQALASRNWFRSHAQSDPVANAKKVKCPLLILQGAKDFQVSPTKDAAVLDAALAGVLHPDHELRVLPGLDHLFKRTPGESSEIADYAASRPIDPAFLDALTEWLRKRSNPARR